MKSWLDAFFTVWRFVFFRADARELEALGAKHFCIALITVWLAGIGRHWDDEKADFLQSSGVGSVIYVFVLAAYLWVALLPLRPRDWSYTCVLVIVCMTAPPAFLYAIPIERWLDENVAIHFNLRALGLIALWRVALFIFFLVWTARMALVARMERHAVSDFNHHHRIRHVANCRTSGRCDVRHTGR